MYLTFLKCITLGLVLSIGFAAGSIFNYDVQDAHGNTVSLSKYKSAKAILIGEVYIAYAPSNCAHVGFLYSERGEQERAHIFQLSPASRNV
jgi:hypothetical protein